MNDVTLPGLIVPIEGRIDQLERALKRANQAQAKSARDMQARAKQSADRMAQTYEAMGGQITGIFSKIKLPVGGPAALAGAIAGSGLVVAANQVRQTVRAVAELGDQAKRSGMDAEAFQRWKFVAETNRVSVDALVDSVKELNLRADEFIITGKGPAEEAFNRLGFGAEDLARRLKNPSDLMLEIVKRMQGLSTAAQIRVADEVFGGTGGERFVELLGLGEAGIKQMMSEASVLSADQIDKAAELDRRYSAFTANLHTGWKRAALGAADFAAQVMNIRRDVDALEASSLFRDPGQAAAILGPDVTGALDGNGQAVNDHAQQIGALLIEYERFGAEANALAPILDTFANQLRRMGEADAADALQDAAQGTRRLTDELDRGEIEAGDFETQMADLIDRARDAMASLSDLDDARFSRVIERLAGLGGALDLLKRKASELRAALPGGGDEQVAAARTRNEAEAASMANLERQREAVEGFTEAENARNAATSEQIRLQREADQVRRRAEEAGVTLSNGQVDQLASEAIAGEDVRRAADQAASGGGADAEKDKAGAGTRDRDQFADAVTKLAEEKAALDAEAVALIAAAGAGKTYANALEFARTRAELLMAAQRQGRAITPALSAEIDKLAQSYVDAGNKAAQAADQMKEMEERGQRGAEALTGAFMSVLDGSKTAEEALADLLLQIAEAQMNKALMGFFSGPAGGFSATVGGLIGYASGGYTGHGGKHEPAGIVHRGEFVVSKAATARIGVSNLEGLHRAALRGYADGGLVGATAKATQAATGTARSATPAQAITLAPTINVNASGGTPEQNADLAKQISAETERAMRNVVRDELIRAQRPGNMLSKR